MAEPCKKTPPLELGAPKNGGALDQVLSPLWRGEKRPKLDQKGPLRNSKGLNTASSGPLNFLDRLRNPRQRLTRPAFENEISRPIAEARHGSDELGHPSTLPAFLI